MKLCYDQRNQYFYCISTFDERSIPGEAKFTWNREKRRWETKDPLKAKLLVQYADEAVLKQIKRCKDKKDIWAAVVTTEEKQLILKALKEVSIVCDGAHTNDTTGFKG